MCGLVKLLLSCLTCLANGLTGSKLNTVSSTLWPSCWHDIRHPAALCTVHLCLVQHVGDLLSIFLSANKTHSQSVSALSTMCAKSHVC